MIAIGCDHGGYELKQKILAHLRQRGLEYRDFGCDSTASVDYPVYGKAVAHAVASGECEKGIVICSTGIGISIAANKVPSIRCALHFFQQLLDFFRADFIPHMDVISEIIDKRTQFFYLIFLWSLMGTI